MSKYMLAAHARIVAASTRALLRMEAMKQENRKREADGESPAYNESAFEHVITEEAIGYNSVVETLQEAIQW